MDTYLPSSYDYPSRANLWTPKMSPDNLFPSGSEPSYVSTEQYWSVGSKGFVLWNHRAAYNLKCKFDYSEVGVARTKHLMACLPSAAHPTSPRVRRILLADAPCGWVLTCAPVLSSGSSM